MFGDCERYPIGDGRNVSDDRNLDRTLARIGKASSRIIDDIQKISPDRFIRAVISCWRSSLNFLCVGQ